MNHRTYLSVPHITAREEDAVLRAIRSGWVAPLGPEVDAFESELAEYCNRQFCVALSSGTAALHLALLAAGVGPGDMVLTSTMTFAATANAISYTGAQPIFIESDRTGNISTHMLEVALEHFRNQGGGVKAIVPVDLLGKIADHESISEMADNFDAIVISDAAESLGAVRNGRPAASFGSAAVVSFNGNKIMTTSGGGALLTDDEGLAKQVRYLSTQARQNQLHYEHTDIGFNYRMSNILAALGRAQLSRVEEMIEARRQHRLAYLRAFETVEGVEVFGEPSGANEYNHTHDNFWLSSLIIDPEITQVDRNAVIGALANNNIEARPLWKPMHLQPVFAGCLSFVDGTSEELFSRGLSLPSSSAMTAAERDRVIGIILRLLGK